MHALWSIESNIRIYPKELIEKCTKKPKWNDVYGIAYNNKQLGNVLYVCQYNIGHLFNEYMAIKKNDGDPFTLTQKDVNDIQLIKKKEK